MPYSIIPLTVFTQTTMIENSVNAYLLKSGDEAILIDAGFAESAPAIEKELANAAVALKGIYLTHYHPDHSLGALRLAKSACAHIHCHPLEEAPLLALYEKHFPHEAVDMLAPNLFGSTAIPFGGERLHIIHAPGHSHGHIAIFDKATGALFSGDTVIPEGTVWIGPPDGHMQDYLETLATLRKLPVHTLYPGHGQALPCPQDLIHAMETRRREREQEIIQFLQTREESVMSLANLLYGQRIPQFAMWAAKKTVTAHLQKLLLENRIALRYSPLEKIFYYRRP